VELTIILHIYQVDSLHSYLHSALQTTNATSDNLDRRFSLLSSSLTSPFQSSPASTHAASLSHPALLRSPSRLATAQQGYDPQDLLRALSRIDAERPPAQISDEARRAVREVQRVAAGSPRGG
jgi:kinetochore protein Mis13/DSN1